MLLLLLNDTPPLDERDTIGGKLCAVERRVDVDCDDDDDDDDPEERKPRFEADGFSESNEIGGAESNSC